MCVRFFRLHRWLFVSQIKATKPLMMDKQELNHRNTVCSSYCVTDTAQGHSVTGFCCHYLVMSIVKQTMALAHPIKLCFIHHTTNDTWTDASLKMIEIREGAKTGEGTDICPSSSSPPPPKLSFKTLLADTKLIKSWIRSEQRSEYHHKDLFKACPLLYIMFQVSLEWFSCCL